LVGDVVDAQLGVGQATAEHDEQQQYDQQRGQESELGRGGASVVTVQRSESRAR
jgi:hypothetical protein